MPGMNVAVLGSDGRSHVLAEALDASSGVERVFGLKGTPGIDLLGKGETVGISPTDFDGVRGFMRQENIGLAVVSPEGPLVKGVADVLRASDVLTIGPSKDAARYEGSKIRFQEFCEQNRLPIVEALGIARSPEAARAFVKNHEYSTYVIKGDGLGAGKATGVPESQKKAEEFNEQLLAGDFSNAAADGIVYQRRINVTRPEVSSYALIDKSGNVLPMGFAQDHKRVGEGDTGLNGGGSGAYSDVPKTIFNRLQQERAYEIQRDFVESTLREEVPYEGFSFDGLMLENDTSEGVRLLEKNVRFGDPEAQVIIPRYVRAGVDFLDVFVAAAEDKLDTISLPQQLGEQAVTIALMSEGYPTNNTVTGYEIFGLDQEFDDDISIYHGGTKVDNEGRFFTSGGRVLYVTAFAPTIREAREKALANIGPDNHGIYFEEMQYRSDTAHQAIDAA